MKILITGFEPFGGESINPSWEAVRHLPDTIAGAEVIKLQIPTVFGRTADVVREAVLEHEPDVVVSVGQAGGRFMVSPERVAINMDDGRIPDNDGKQPIDKPVVKDGPAAYFATLPIKACVAAMRKAGLPAAVSNTAGTFVCNHILYSLMDIAQDHSAAFRGGFLHIPYVPEQVARVGAAPSMALDDIVRGIEIVLEVSAERTVDIHTVEGRIS